MIKLTGRKQGLQGSSGIPMLPLFFLILFFYIPVLSFLLPSLSSSVQGLPGGMGRIFLFTLFQALLSAALSLLGGLPGAFLLSRYRFKGQGIIKALLTIPFVLPPILAVLGFVLFFGSNGIINRSLMIMFKLESPPLSLLYSLKAILMAHIFFNIPIAVRFLQDPFSRLPVHQIQAARSLGAGWLRRFRTIIWPHLRPSVHSVFLLIFLYCFMSFAVILVLGGGPQFTTMEIKVYQLVRYDLNFAQAGRIGLIEIVVTLSAVLLYIIFQQKGQTLTANTELPATLKKPSATTSLMAAAYFAALGVLILGPLISIMFSSFRIPVSRGGEKVFSLSAYRELITAAGGFRQGNFRLALLRTLLTAGGASLVTTLLLLPEAEKISRRPGRWQALPFLLPLGISSLFLGAGYLQLKSLLNLNQYWALIMLIFIQSSLSFPISFRAVHLAAQKLPGKLYESAEICGAGPLYRFRTVTWPLLKNGFLTAAVFSFALAAGEMTSAVVLLPSSAPTLPLYIYQQIGGYDFNGAAASGTILILLCTLAFYLMDRTERRDTWILK